jgi:hypothetical protein
MNVHDSTVFLTLHAYFDESMESLSHDENLDCEGIQSRSYQDVMKIRDRSGKTARFIGTQSLILQGSHHEYQNFCRRNLGGHTIA